MSDGRERDGEFLKNLGDGDVPATASRDERTAATGPDRLLEELRVHQAELEMQNEELRAARESMEVSWDRFSALFHRTPVGYVLLDERGMILEVNETFLRMVGRTKDRVRNGAFFAFIGEGDRSVFQGHYEALFNNPAGKSAEFELLTEGESVWVRMDASRIGGFEDSPMEEKSLLFLTLGDISERKRAEERESHIKRVLMAVRNVNQLIVQETDPLRLIDTACKNLTETLGYFQAWIALLDETGRVQATASSGFAGGFDAMRTGLKSGAYPAYVRRTLNQDRITVVEDPVSECPDCPLSELYATRAGFARRLEHGGKVFGLLAVSVPSRYAPDREEQDLFEELAGDLAFGLHKIQSAEALRLSEEKFSTAFQTSPYIITITRAEDGRFVDVNDAFTRISGYTREEALADSSIGLRLWVDENDRNRAVSALSRGEKVVGEEFLFRIKNGEIITGLFSAQVVRIHDEVCILSSINDITDRKRVEQSLLNSHLRLETAVRAGHVGLWDWDVRSDRVRYSPEWKRQIGYEEDEIGEDFQEWESRVHPEDLGPALDKVASFVHSDATNYWTEFRFRHKDGSYRWILAQATVQRDEAGGPVRVLGSHVDITERKREEQLTKLRLMLIEFAAEHTLDQLLTKALDEIGALVESPIGFYHFVEEDQETLCLQQWSTSTLERFCKAQGQGMHYPVHQAGVWVECVHTRKPVIHNDYASLPNKKGLPAGHAEVIRELLVPVMREDRVVAILGVGNKPGDYSQRDAEMVSYLADVTWEIVKRKRTEEALRESEARHRMILQTAMDGFWMADERGRPLTVNDAYCRMSGYSREELLAMRISDLEVIQEGEDLAAHLRKVVEQGQDRFETRHRGKDGTVFDVEISVQYLPAEESRFMAFIRDITRRNLAEAEKERLRGQLIQAQKMESVGRLAGGVAHDFNNMLGVILGHAELAIEQTKPGEPLFSDLREIQKAAQRSADLTRQLLAFARKQTISPQVLDLNQAVEGMLKMLRRLIGEDIDLSWLPGGHLWKVYMDPSQVDQVVANLCVNARDAVGKFGKITIETENMDVDEGYCAHRPGLAPGEYVVLSVSDNGCGMDRETLSQLFEPFFTTKRLGKGTGLGLATVYGIVKQNEGHINVYSEPGKGTSFRVYFPRYSAEGGSAIQERAAQRVPGGDETILMVEDEEAMLKMAKTMLERLGYRVLAAGAPDLALALADEHAGEIDLLITDVVMPGMNGKELAQRLLELYPRIGTLFASGYTANVIADHGVLDEGVHFIQKPFSAKELASKVREALSTKSTGR